MLSSRPDAGMTTDLGRGRMVVAPWSPTHAPSLVRMGLVRITLIGMLPLVILASSPQRVPLSIALAIGYFFASILITRPSPANSPGLVYAIVAATFMALSLLRAQFTSGLTADQHEYALAKGIYFIFAVLPLSAAISLLVVRIQDLKPAVVAFVIMGLTLALLTITLRNPGLLGEERYTWQGNLIAISVLLLFQLWVIRRFWAGVSLGLICL